MRYLDIKQVGAALKVAYKKNRRDHLMLLLSFNHGLRASEIANLRIGDVSGGRIRVARVKGSLLTVQPLVVNKNPLFDEPKALATWMEIRPATTDALFPSRKGKGTLRADSVGKMAVYYLEKAGVPADLAHHHIFKHSIASLMIRGGVDLAFVKSHLGHASISSTIHYTNIQDFEATEKAQAVIQKALE